MSVFLSKMFDVGDLPVLTFGNWVLKAEWLNCLWNYMYVFLTFFLRFFQNPKKHDFLRFFWVVAHVFPNSGAIRMTWLTVMWFETVGLRTRPVWDQKIGTQNFWDAFATPRWDRSMADSWKYGHPHMCYLAEFISFSLGGSSAIGQICMKNIWLLASYLSQPFKVIVDRISLIQCNLGYTL